MLGVGTDDGGSLGPVSRPQRSLSPYIPGRCGRRVRPVPVSSSGTTPTLPCGGT